MNFDTREQIRLRIQSSQILVFVSTKTPKNTVKFKYPADDPLDLTFEYCDAEGKKYDALFDEHSITLGDCQLENGKQSFTFHFYIRKGTILSL
jgi:hypothetical protein